MSKKEGYILVGLGDRSVAELVNGVKEDSEFFSEVLDATVNDVPHYKTFTSSSQEEQAAFLEYMEMLKQFVEEEKTDG